MGFFNSLFNGNNCNNNCYNPCNPCGNNNNNCNCNNNTNCYDQTNQCNPCNQNAGCQPCGCYMKPDIVLTANLERPTSPLEIAPLPMTQTTCEYKLVTSEVTTLKTCRNLVVKGSVQGEIIIIVQKGTDTPREFRFVNSEVFLKEQLHPGDKVTFSYKAGATAIKLEASIKYRCYYHDQ